MRYRVVEFPKETFQQKKKDFDKLPNGAKMLDMSRGGMTFPPGGGIEAYLVGEKYPKKGYPFPREVHAVCLIKRTIVLTIRMLSKTPLILAVPLLAIWPWRLLELFSWYVDGIDSGFLNPRYFCKSGREVWRAGMEAIRQEKRKNLLERLLLTICTIWEFDDAYRYPGQYTLSKVDKKNVKRNVASELKRLLLLAADRTILPESGKVADRWRAISKFVGLALFIRRDLRRIIKAFFLEVDPERVKLDEADQYFCKDMPFNFKGKP